MRRPALTGLRLDVHRSILDINPDQWERWFGVDYPFLSWSFLAALERAQCTSAQNGWEPFHLILWEQGDNAEEEQVIAVAPGFLKSHSYGEYVFDWAWADAWQRTGRSYYPKLVSAAPFTPATGPRLYLNQSASDPAAKLLEAICQMSQDQEFSGWHVLFEEPELAQALKALGLHERQTCQFHWFNRNYQSFDDFLATFTSRKRKNLRKERANIEAQGLTLETLEGDEITPNLWSFFHYCYQVTYAKRSGHGGYLTREFFIEECQKLARYTVMVVAHDENTPVAAALYFRSADTLYGRYWGCLREYEHLHFEACYYRGIEYCIAHGLEHFDPGAQGEHKIQRGFEPVLTHSSHWVADPSFTEAVAGFCREECNHVAHYQRDAQQLLPFKAD